MACCSDVVILHDSAKFGLPEPRVGFIPSQVIPFVVRRVGEGAARDLAVSGRVIDAAEACRLGIGRYLCRNTAEIGSTLRGLLDDILKMEPQALATVKRLVLACATADDRTVLDDGERARVSVTRSIRYALARLAEVSPAVAAHLQQHVHTGTFCSYQPDALHPITWGL